jgi:hypothetical protein
MRRWHEERALMLRRWREEIAIHEGLWPPSCVIVLPPEIPDSSSACHCYRGMGFLRKHRPWGHSRPRCYTCKSRKLFPRPTRAYIKRATIEFELDAWGNEPSMSIRAPLARYSSRGDRALVGII